MSDNSLQQSQTHSTVLSQDHDVTVPRLIASRKRSVSGSSWQLSHGFAVRVRSMLTFVSSVSTSD